MRRLLIGLALCATACNSTPEAAQPTATAQPGMSDAGQPQWQASGPLQPRQPGAPVATTPRTTPTATPADPAALAASAPLPTIPAGARYTLFCDAFSGPDHVQRAAEIKKLLTTHSKLKDWYVIHQEGQSSLYHGYYREFDVRVEGDAASKKDAARAQRDRETLEMIPNPNATNRKLFPRSMFVPLDAPDPTAPPEWNLTNAPGYWTVQIAAYTGPDRKQAAVESVRGARQMNVPAFYYHGETVSSVCIGNWPDSAVKRQQAANAEAVEGQDIVVNVSDEELPDSVKGRVGTDGRPLRVLQPKLEILDGSLKATLAQYPDHATDGAVDMRQGIDKATGRKVMVPRRSLLVTIPRDAKALAGGLPANEPDAELVNPNANRNDLQNRLRGLGR